MVDRKALLDRIRAYQFALIDLGLYQDPRPDDEQAQKPVSYTHLTLPTKQRV